MGGKKKKEDPKSEESEISTAAEARILQMSGGKRIRAMLRNRWGAVEWDPMDGKHLGQDSCGSC